MNSNEDDDLDLHWKSVIGRSLAYLCLHAAELEKADIARKAAFLMSLGLKRKDVAAVLRTTEETVRVTLRKAKTVGRAKLGTKER